MKGYLDQQTLESGFFLLILKCTVNLIGGHCDKLTQPSVILFLCLHINFNFKSLVFLLILLKSQLAPLAFFNWGCKRMCNPAQTIAQVMWLGHLYFSLYQESH